MKYRVKIISLLYVCFKGSIMKDKIRNYKIVNIVILGLVIYMLIFPQISQVLETIIPNSTKCVYLSFTGKECPLCGGTRYIKNIKNVFKDITYLFNFFGIIVIGSIAEGIFRIFNLCNLNNEKYISKVIVPDIIIHIIGILLFIMYEIIFIMVNK